jgi:GTPase SAR1 family protein
MACNLYFIGTAGSGKSAMTQAFQSWMQSQKLDTVTVNLDPGAETLPYEPDVDVRDWVVLKDVMQEQGLGPNGAQILCADLAALSVREMVDVLEEFHTDYILIDTPGQMELFTFRESSRVIVDAFGPDDSALVYLNDPALVKRASGLVSSILLSAITQFRHMLPFINVLAKADLLSEEAIEEIVKWSTDPYALHDSLVEEGTTPKTVLDIEFLKAMESIGLCKHLIPASAETQLGFGDVYDIVQQTFQGGEDLRPD